MGLYTEEVYDLDTNVLNAISAWMDCKDVQTLSLAVFGESGSHATHAVKLQCSPDGNENHVMDMTKGDTNSLVKITGEGMKKDVPICAHYVRAVVETAEGSASMCKVFIQGK